MTSWFFIVEGWISVITRLECSMAPNYHNQDISATSSRKVALKLWGLTQADSASRGPRGPWGHCGCHTKPVTSAPCSAHTILPLGTKRVLHAIAWHGCQDTGLCPHGCLPSLLLQARPSLSV